MISFKLCLLCYRNRAPCTMDPMARVLSLVGVPKEIFVPCAMINKIQLQPYWVTVMITVITQLSERKKEKKLPKVRRKDKENLHNTFRGSFSTDDIQKRYKTRSSWVAGARQFFIRSSQWSEWHSNSYVAWLGAQKNCSSLIHTCFFSSRVLRFKKVCYRWRPTYNKRQQTDVRIR